jgi:mannose-6-phosphate isomerase-like protein (cupin superfamily)
MGNVLHFHVFSHEVGGKYCLVEARVAPGAGAPPNRHRDEEEVIAELEGTFDFVLDGQHLTAGPGEVVQVPNGALHHSRNRGTSPGRQMIVNAPEAIHHAFFIQLGEPAPEHRWVLPPPGPAADIAALVAKAAVLSVAIELPTGP